MRVVVLGAGLVGGAIARDLASGGEFEVTVVDTSQAALARLADQPGVVAMRADLTAAAEVRRALEHQDLVVGAVPGHMGLATLRKVLDCRKPVVDISFSRRIRSSSTRWRGRRACRHSWTSASRRAART